MASLEPLTCGHQGSTAFFTSSSVTIGLLQNPVTLASPSLHRCDWPLWVTVMDRLISPVHTGELPRAEPLWFI
jgi:hypothetical protein